MALFQCKLFSKELFRSVNVNVLLPTPDSNNDFFDSPTVFPKPGQKYQVLWLLHGISADESDWQRFSSVERYAQGKNVAVVMPDGYNSMYVDNPWGGKYFSYLTQELPTILCSLLPLSAKREDNFIAGLSMGGYGAFRAALLKPERYAAAASLSGGLTQKKLAVSGIQKQVLAWRKNAYGPNEEYFVPEQHDLQVILENQLRQGVELPRLYECCGTEDFLHQDNIAFRNQALEQGADLTYEEGPGVHNFDFWDPYIRRVLDWLPLKGKLVE